MISVEPEAISVEPKVAKVEPEGARRKPLIAPIETGIVSGETAKVFVEPEITSFTAGASFIETKIILL